MKPQTIWIIVYTFGWSSGIIIHVCNGCCQSSSLKTWKKHAIVRVLCPNIILHMWPVCLAHFRDCYTLTCIWNKSPLEDQGKNTICDWIWLANKLWLILETTRRLVPTRQSQNSMIAWPHLLVWATNEWVLQAWATISSNLVSTTIGCN